MTVEDQGIGDPARGMWGIRDPARGMWGNGDAAGGMWDTGDCYVQLQCLCGLHSYIKTKTTTIIVIQGFFT